MNKHEQAIADIEEAVEDFTDLLKKIREFASPDAARCFSVAITKGEEMCMWMARGIKLDEKQDNEHRS